MKRTLHKALSMLLTAAMVLNMGLTPVFAEGVAIGASGLSDCHTAHDSECGYSETIQMGGCTHEHSSDCGFTEGTEEQPCTFIADGDAEASPSDADEHSHDDTCGYAPATEGTPCEHKHDDVCGYGKTVTVTPCTHTCAVCEGLDSGKPAEKVCTCGAVDSGALVHGENCPLYTAPELSEAVQALIAMVDALPNGLDITEENKEATIPAFEAAAMAYGELSDEDKAAFEATSQYTKLMALREVLFGLNTLELNYSTNWQGKGTSADPYLITSVEELRGIAYATKNMGQYNSIYLRLTIDIDLENEEWTPISNPSDVRYIAFDGDNHIISNYTVTNPSDGAAGLFGTMYGNIKNLGVSGATITATDGYGGAILGNKGTTDIDNCYVVNSTVTGKNVGGIAGVCYTLENCYTGADVEVTGRLSAGGLAYVVTGNVTNCYFAGTVTGGSGKEIFGGNGQTTITNCYALNTSVSEDMKDYDKIPPENIKTAAEFASGEVTYLLNSSNDIIYRQTIGTDSFPTLNSSSGVVYRQGEESSYTYSNDDTITHTISWTENNEIYTIVPESGYDTTVDDSGSFRFRVKLTDEEAYRPEIYVRANGKDITASGGVYMISQIRENKEITVSASKKTCRIFMQKNLFETFGDNGKWKMRLDPDRGYNSNNGNGYFSVPYGESITFKLTVNGNYGWSTDGAKLTYDNQSVNHDEGFPGQFTFANIKENHTVSAITDVTKKQFAIAFQSAGGYTIEKADTEGDLNADQYGSFSFVVTPPAGMESEPYTVKLADPNGKGYVRDGNFIINLDWDISQYIVDINDPDIRYTTNVLKDNGGGKYTIDCVAQNLNVLILPLSFKQNLSSTTKTYSRLGEKDGDTYKTPLTVLASADSETQLADKEVQYDWYRNTKNSAEGATKLNIDKSMYYIPADQPAGTYYYFVEAFYSDSPTIRIQSKIQRVDIVKEIAKLKLDSDKTSYTYGDPIKFTANVSIPTTRVRAVATANTVDFYCGETKLNSAPITLTESNGIGTVDFTYNTAGKGIPTGTQTITAVYGGSDNLKDQTATNNITLNQKPLTATITSGNSKVYDGNSNFPDAVLTLGSGEVLSGDTVSASANIAAKNADVGENKALVATGITLTGEGADWYSLTSDYITGNLSITPATPSVKVTAVKQEKSLLRSIIGDHNDTIILTATTKGVGSEKPDGQVVFKNGSTILETKTTSNGVATYEWKNPPTGNYTITAEFTASDSNYISTAVTGTADGFEISKGTQDALTVNVPTLTYGDTDKSLTTTGGSGAGAVTYTVTEGDCITVNANTGAITVVKEGDAKVTATKAGDTNFNSITSGETQIKVNLATPTVAWASDTQTLTYTGNPAAITSPTVTGIAAGDTSSGTISYAYKKVDGFTRGLFAGYTDGLPKDAGKYEIKAQIAAAGNYDKADSTNVLKLTVEQKTSTLTINSYTGKTYDGNAVIDPTNITSNVTTPTVNYTYYLADGMTKTTKANSGASGTGKAPVNAGDYKVTGTIEETPNTTAITSAAVSFAISQSPLTINGGTVTSKKYDSTTTATVTALTFVGLQNGEALEIATDYTVGTPMFDTAAVGDGKTVTGTAALVNNGKTNNYSLTGAFVNVKGNITLADGPAAPINGVVDDTKGTDTFTFDSTSGVIYEYKINDGAWTDITASGATTAISVGNIAVPVGELQVRVKKTDTHATGAILSNDTKFTASIEGSVAIAGTATYGETLTATATGTQTGAVLSYEWKTNEGTILQAESASSTYKIAGAAVGSTITVAVTATGYDGKLTSTATATVGKKAVTATANTISKVYDGTNAVETADQALSIPKVNSSDEITVTMPNATYNDATVGASKVITVGTLTITGAAASWYDVTAPSGLTGEITVKPLTSATVTVNGTYTYTGAAQTPAAANITVKDGSATVDAANYDVTSVTGNTNAGEATVNVTFKGNYSGTASGKFTIKKAPLTITGYTAENKEYDGTDEATVSAVTFTGTQNSESLTLTTDYTVSAKFTSKNVGSAVAVTGTVTLANSATAKNYSLADGALTGQTAQIKAIDPSYSVANQNIKIGKKLDGIQAATTATGVNSETVAGTLNWSETSGGAALTDYTFTGAAGNTITLYWTFTPTGGNYKALSGSTTFTLTEKEVPTLTVSNIGKTYDGTAVTAVTGGIAKVGEATIAGTFAFDGAPTMQNANIYNVTVKFTPTNTADYETATTSITVTIKKVALTVKANDVDILVDAAKPSYTATTTGLVNGEIISGVTFTPENPDTSTKGTFAITPAGGTISGGGNGNYNISYVTGTLTIKVDVTAIDTALNTANSAKSGITTSDQPASSVASGTKFVTTAEMKALTDAIATATAAMATVSTKAEAEQAANALSDAVDTFKAAIKTGTYTAPSGGGGGSTGGGGNSGGSTTPTTPPAITDPTLPENGTVNIKPSVDKDGNATVTVSDNNIADAIKKAQDEAKKNGTEKNGIAVTITIDTNQTLNSFTANLPKSTQEKLIAAGVTTLTINGGATITFDLEAIKQIKTTANTDVTVIATKTANSALSKEAQAATGGRPVYDFKVTGGGKNITTFGSGKLSLSIPYELQKVDGNGKPSATGSFENPGNLVGVYIDANGKLTYLPGSSYNATSKTMLISTTHLSVYGVAYKTNAPTFTDTATHWAKDDIQFVAARGLLTGTTATTFSPNTSMTRGMFVTALGRLAGIDTNSYKTGSFTDVKTDAYYAPYVNWAVQNNIVTGTSTTTFAPDSAITRQEMAVMTANYAKAIGYKLPSVHKEIIFTDSASIGAWAKSAVKEMQMAGILMGKDGGKFDPTGTATRAEVSAMLRRFVELVANSETAEGWVTNDSGNWMYFENGKAVTGKKKIDGTTYEFDRYGVTAILPKDRRFTLYTVQKGDSFWAIASKYKVNIFELVSLNGKNIFSTIHPGDELKIPQK